MKEPPRSRQSASDITSTTPHRRYSNALARNTVGAWRSGDTHRSVRRPSQTPRDSRSGDRQSRPGTLPPVPGRLLFSLPAAGLLLALLTWQVVSHGPLWRGDRRVDAAVLRAAARDGFLRPWAQVAADLGDVAVAVPALVVVLGYVGWRTRDWAPVVGYAGVMALTGAVVVPLKAAVGRPAPGSAVLAGHSGYFPSGHAVTFAVAYGLAVLAVLPSVRRAAARRLLVLAAVPLNLLVGAALVWRGYHWPLDVVAAWCLCWVLLGAARVVTSWWGTRG